MVRVVRDRLEPAEEEAQVLWLVAEREAGNLGSAAADALDDVGDVGEVLDVYTRRGSVRRTSSSPS